VERILRRCSSLGCITARYSLSACFAVRSRIPLLRFRGTPTGQLTRTSPCFSKALSRVDQGRRSLDMNTSDDPVGSKRITWMDNTMVHNHDLLSMSSIFSLICSILSDLDRLVMTSLLECCTSRLCCEPPALSLVANEIVLGVHKCNMNLTWSPGWKKHQMGNLGGHRHMGPDQSIPSIGSG